MARPIDPCQLGLWDPRPAAPTAPTRLAMSGAEVLYFPALLTAVEAAALFAALRPVAPFKQDRRKMYDRVIDVPRLSHWYGQDEPWPAALTAVRAQVEAATGLAYDSVLLNLYRDGRDSVAWHRDDVDRFGQDEIIASLSLGATRRFMFRPRHGGESLALDLPAGSLLLMGRGTQTHWEHCVPKTARPVGERLNLTFRRRAGAPD